VYQAAIEEKAPESSALLTSAVRRVDAALNEIFPILGDRESDVHRIVR
jgi:hypothetical protein